MVTQGPQAMNWNEFRMPKCQWPVAKATLIELGLYTLWTVCKSMWVLWKAYSTTLQVLPYTSASHIRYTFWRLFFLVLKLTLQTSLGVTLQGDNSNQGTLKIIQWQRFWKQKILKFCGKRTNNIHKCEGFFLRGRVSSNGFKVFNSCIVLLEFYRSGLHKY